MPNRNRPSFSRRTLPIMGIVALLTGVVIAEEVTVQRNHVDILSGKSSLYLPPLATAQHGEKLQVEEHQGRWLKVTYKGVEGYVLEASLAGADAPTAGTIGAAAQGSADLTASAAAKGWDSVTWSKDHGYSTDGIKAMAATRDRIRANPSKFEQFKSDGHVGEQ